MNTQNSPLLLTHEDFPVSLRHLLDGFSEAEVKLVKEAYRISVAAHAWQQRNSLHAYIPHIRDVLSCAGEQSKSTSILLTPDDIIVALLHDTLEDHPEYFDEIYKKFGYTILVRILWLSKPSRLLYKKWLSIVDRENQETMPYQVELYKFWTTVIENWDSPSLHHKVVNVSRDILRKYEKDSDAPSDIFKELERIYNAYRLRLDDLRYMSYSTPEEIDKKDKISDKRWKEYTAELQIFLNPKENFKIKLADKMSNLGDTAFHGWWGSPQEKDLIHKKSKSILKSVYTYRWLAQYHGLSTLIPGLTQLETSFNTSLALHSPGSGFPSQQGSH